MRIYNYIYYKLHIFFSQINHDMSGFLAMMAMCWLFLINLFAVFLLIHTYNSIISRGYTKLTGVILGLIIVFIHSVYFNKKKSFVILKKYKDEGIVQNIIGTISVLLYVTLSFYILFKFTVPGISGIYS